MSGSARAIVLNLSVRDADVVRQQLLQMGEAGEAALSRLDAAARRTTAGGGALPQISTGAQAATRDFGTMRNAIGQAGFQIQDFAVQVQGGTSAITALSQQGSQMLGVFGPGGAIAGAVLTVGLLAYQLLAGRDAADELAEAQKRLETATNAANDLFETQIEKVQRLERAARSAVIETSSLAAAQLRLQQASRADRLAQLEPTMQQVRDAQAIDPDTYLPENIRRRASEYYRIQEELTRTAEQLDQLDRRMENARTGAPTGAQLDAGRPGQNKSSGGGGGRRAPSDAPGINVQDAIDRSPWAQSQRDLNAYNQELNLNAAGLSGAASALAAYERNMGMLNGALQNGVITEQQFAMEVENGSVRLAKQIETIEERTDRASTAATNFGFTFNSQLENMILTGGKAGDVLKALEQDLARMILRAAVTQPLGNAVSMGVNLLMKTLMFEDGGIMTATGPVPLRRYAGGGVANEPQLAMFGEGSTPEAYVPLPDGRSIPVKMQGGGAPVFAPTYNIDARGADPSMLPQLDARMRSIAAQSLAQFSDSIQRGGQAARLVGRR